MVLRARVLLAQDKKDEALKVLNGIATPSAETVGLAEKIRAAGTESPKELEEKLAREPGNAYLLGRLCSAYRVSDPARSLEYCRKANEAEPNNISHAIGFAAALVQAKAYPQAESILKRLKAAAPDNSTVRANLATALFQQKKYAEAKPEYQWLIGKQPDLPAAYYFAAITHDQLGEYLDAMANYQQFLKIADAESNKLEIEKVNLRLPALQRQIKEGKGRKNE
jgi:tetratricopeptide (TPR) repeat protein